MQSNKTYEINFFTSSRDAAVRVTEHLLWSQLVELFSVHTVTDNRDRDSYMFNMCSFKKTDFEPSLDSDSYTDGSVFARRCADNVESYNCLVLDYDGDGVVMADIIELFADYKHLGYTSHNHVVKGVDKFRIILPFATVCPITEWESRKGSVKAFSKCDDKSTTATSRSFYMPSHAPGNERYAFVWAIDGKELTWESLPVVKPTVTGTKPVSHTPKSNKQIEHLLNTLVSYYPIMDYTQRRDVTWAVASECSEADAIALMRVRWPDGQYNGKYETYMAGFDRKGITLGTIVHMIRVYEPTYKLQEPAYKDPAKVNAVLQRIKSKILVQKDK